MPKTPKKVKPAKTALSEPAHGNDGLSKAVDGVAEELRDLRHLDTISDNLGDLGSAMHTLADALALSVIATLGTDEDRKVVVDKLKNWYRDDFS